MKNLEKEIEKIVWKHGSYSDGKCPYCEYQCETRGKTNGVTQHIFHKHFEKRKTKSMQLLALFRSTMLEMVGKNRKRHSCSPDELGNCYFWGSNQDLKDIKDSLEGI